MPLALPSILPHHPPLQHLKTLQQEHFASLHKDNTARMNIKNKSILVLETTLITRLIRKSLQQKKMPQSGICPAPCGLRQCTSPLPPLQYICKAMHKSSMHENVIFSLCAHGQCHVYYIYHVEFHFRFGHLITFRV